MALLPAPRRGVKWVQKLAVAVAVAVAVGLVMSLVFYIASGGHQTRAVSDRNPLCRKLLAHSFEASGVGHGDPPDGSGSAVADRFDVTLSGTERRRWY